MKEQKKISLESLVSEIEKNGRIGRLGKVFKTEKNYYFYDTGTGKVAKWLRKFTLGNNSVESPRCTDKV